MRKGKRERPMYARELILIELKFLWYALVIVLILVAMDVASDFLSFKSNTDEECNASVEAPTIQAEAHEAVAVTPVVIEPVQPVQPVQIVAPKVEEQEAQPAMTMNMWANARITAYCPCEKCCGKYGRNRPVDPDTGELIVTGSSGERLHSKVSCASSLPFGTKLYIPELDLYTTVQDRAAPSIHSKYNGKYVDIYIDNHDECFSYLAGHNAYMEVYIVE